MTRLKYVTELIAGQSPASQDVDILGEGLPFLQGNAEFGESSPGPRYECSAPPKRCQKGDLLLSVRAPVGAVNIADRAYGIGRGLCAICPRDVVPNYLRWWLHHARPQLEERATGSTFAAVSTATVGDLRLPDIPQARQRAIADYLDRETARIDTLIGEQQRLIEMLRERRQAVVDHEINARNGVPLVSLRGLVIAPITAGADETSDPSNPSWWPRFVRTTDIASLTRLDPEKRVTADPESTGDAMLARNDLVATRAGATIGKTYIHLSDEPASYAGYLVRIRPNPARVVPMYLAYWSQSCHYLDQVAVGAVKSTIENYSASKYRATRVPVPTLDEQQRVVAHLDEQTAKIDTLVDETERFIELSRERRAALITAAVTGQIDVREVA